MKTNSSYEWLDYSDFEPDRGGEVWHRRYEVDGDEVLVCAVDPATGSEPSDLPDTVELVRHEVAQRVLELERELAEARRFRDALDVVATVRKVSPW